MKLIGKIDEVVRGKFLSKRNPVFLFVILLHGSIANAEMVQDNTTLPSAHWSLGIGGFNPTGGLSSSLVLPNWGSVYVEALLNWGVYGFLGDDPKGSRPIPLLGGGNLPVKNGALNARLGIGWKISEERGITGYFWSKGIQNVQYSGNYRITTYYGENFSAPVIKSTIFILDLMYEPSGSNAQVQQRLMSEYTCTFSCGGITKYYEYENSIVYRPINSLYFRPKIRWQTFYDFLYTIDGETRHYQNFFYFDLGPIVAPNLKQYGFWFEFASLGGFTMRLGLGWIYRKDFPALPTAGTQTVGSASYTYRNDTSTLHEHYFPFLFTMEYGSDVR